MTARQQGAAQDQEIPITSITTTDLTTTSRKIAEQARQEYYSLFPSMAEAVDFENQALSIGDDFLPGAAIEVLRAKAEGREFSASSDYWAWLSDEVEAGREG